MQYLVQYEYLLFKDVTVKCVLFDISLLAHAQFF